MRALSSKVIPFVGIAIALSAACGDPVFDAEIRALGDERDGVPVGEFHRAGQPCVMCHAAGGAASGAVFSVAGSVFSQQADVVGVDGATLAMTDTTGSSYTVKTNCVGNFFVRRTDWDPSFPVLVRVWKGDKSRTMQGQVGRERSCANCHKDPYTKYDSLSSVGHVYLYSPDDAVPPASSNCAVDPRLGGSK